MNESEASARVIATRGEELTRDEVRRIAIELARPAPAETTVIDCSSLQRVSLDGLAALLELAAGPSETPALASLSRALLRSAVQARLAQHFTIYATPESFVASRGRAEGERG